MYEGPGGLLLTQPAPCPCARPLQSGRMSSRTTSRSIPSAPRMRTRTLRRGLRGRVSGQGARGPGPCGGACERMGWGGRGRLQSPSEGCWAAPRWPATVQEAAEERQGQTPATSAGSSWRQHRGGAACPSFLSAPPFPLLGLGERLGARLGGGVAVASGAGPDRGLGSPLWVLLQVEAWLPSGFLPPLTPIPNLTPSRPDGAWHPLSSPFRCWASTPGSGRPF